MKKGEGPVKNINNIDVRDYVTHPRILELRVICLFNHMENFMDYNKALEVVELVCKVFAIDKNKLMTIIDNYARITKLARFNKVRYNQEMVFMGAIYGQTRYEVSEKYTGYSKRALYASNDYKIEYYVTREWLKELDNEVFICGASTYCNEAKKFVEACACLSNLFD